MLEGQIGTSFVIIKATNSGLDSYFTHIGVYGQRFTMILFSLVVFRHWNHTILANFAMLN